MNRQRGMADIGILLIVALAVSLAGWYAYQTIDNRAYKRGESETDAKYAKRDNKALADANAKIQQLQTEARAIEAMRAAQVNQISTKYQEDTENAKREVAILNARLRDGSLRLRDPGATCPTPGGNGRVPEAPSRPGERDGGAAGQLSVAASEFLIALASSADETAARLSACQAIVRADRK